jgi:uncharacterized membrane protein
LRVSPRHCERSEAIQPRREARKKIAESAATAVVLVCALRARWIASLRSQ